MRLIAGVFAVSVIAIMSVIPVQADVVSTDLLDRRLGTKVSTDQGTANAGKGLVVDGTTGNLTLTDIATQAELNTVAAAKQDKSTAVTHTANTAAGDSTHPVYVTASGVATKIDKVAAAATADSATSAALATRATHDGDGNNIVDTYATQSALDGKVATAQGTTNAKKVLATNSTGAVVPASITGAGSVSVSVADTGAITVTGAAIPTVNNATLTVQGNGDMAKTFSANQATNETLNIKGGGSTTVFVDANKNIVISSTDNNTTYPNATRDTVGVAKLGVIPVGTTGTTTATMWVE